MPSSRRLSLAVVALSAVAAATLSGCGRDDAPAGGGSKGAGGAMPGPTVGTMSDQGLTKPPEGSGGGASRGQRPPPAFRFEDHSAASGITAVNHSGTQGVKEYLIEAVGPGPAVLDFDRDGRMDLYVPDGDVFDNYDLVKETDPAKPGALRPVLRPKSPRAKTFNDHLYRNVGDGRFEDVTERAGIVDHDWSFGALAWDYDGDGLTDLFVAGLGRCRLWRNKGNGTFEDVAERVGLAGDPTSWNTCASCGDYDGDGRLDLFVGRYADPAAEVERQRSKHGIREGTPPSEIPGRDCLWRGLKAYCGPIGLVGQLDSIYHQEPDGTFRDVTVEVGMTPKSGKYAFTTYWFDYDGDGLLDLYVANDSEENFLWKQERKDGKIRFRDVAEQVGVKYGQSQNAQASMGNTVADINQDGLLDIFVTNFSHDYNNIYMGVRYPGGVSFKDRGLQVMGQAVFYDLSWGCGWYDFDNDADLDLLVANGHVYKEVDLFEKTGTSYEQYCAVFECLEAKGLKFSEVGPKPFKGPNAKPPAGLRYEDVFAGAGLEIKKCYRGATFFDFDNDGDVDVLLAPMNDAPVFLRNDLAAAPERGWLKLSTRFLDDKNPEGIGAVVQVTTPGGPTQTFPVFRCQSFLGTDDPRIHVGVGAAPSATVTVLWPGPAATRKKTTYELPAVNRGYVLSSDGSVAELPLPR